MMDDRAWRTSSYSGGQGNCLEVATRHHGNRVILVRDTKDRTGPVLRFSPAAWRRFAYQVRRSLAPDPTGPRPRPPALIVVLRCAARQVYPDARR
jgi:hypothetical protein